MRLILLLSVAILANGSIAAGASTAEFLLMTQDLQTKTARLVSLDQDTIVYRGPGDRRESEPISRFLALAAVDVAPELPNAGVLVLADGQRFPGEAVATDGDEDVVGWRHPWMGRMDLPLDDVASVIFQRGAALPEPGEGDVVLLANGDRLEGFLVALSDPLVLEVGIADDARLIELPLRQVASVRLITPPQRATGMRVWLSDGTVIEARQLEIDDSERARLLTAWHADSGAPTRLMVAEIAGVIRDASRLVPLAALDPVRVEGPETRYTVPVPTVVDGDAVLGLASIEYRGPLIARYTLPAGATRFAAEAVLPVSARAWGDYELIVRDDRNELFRKRLNASSPEALINVEVTGRELTLELAEGTYAAIQDHLILQRPRLLVE